MSKSVREALAIVWSARLRAVERVQPQEAIELLLAYEILKREADLEDERQARKQRGFLILPILIAIVSGTALIHERAYTLDWSPTSWTTLVCCVVFGISVGETLLAISRRWTIKRSQSLYHQNDRGGNSDDEQL